ncbi:MAG: Eco57I restriction-modification methylase domain-containing protein, partial [Chloroflexota bacterium]
MTDSITHITSSGGLISAAFIQNIRELDSHQPGTEPESFSMPGRPPTPSRAALEDDIAAAWELMLERWDAIYDEVHGMDVSQVRNRWLLPLFSLLDFDPVYVRGDVVLDEAGERYPLSHRGWDDDDAPYLHTVIPAQDLDERNGSGRGIKSKSPHDVLQAYLNASSDDLWAVLSNGILLRVLRKYHHIYTHGYLQFDLEAIFETRNYGDFRALYRTCHASRFVPSPLLAGGTEGGLSPLEQFYRDSLATGIRVGEDLRGQVRQAIETLGNGFLAASPELVRRLQNSPLQAGGTERGLNLCQQFYGEILRLVYRVLFLLFAEQRGMMPGRDSLYAETYAIAALRRRAEGDLPQKDDFTDLWEGLRVTFKMVRQGAPALDVFGYDGMLFAAHQTPLLNGRGLRNSDLLHAIRDLTLIQREGVLQRISYADLGVEELGSIYESLLDFTPRVTGETEMVEDREIPPHTFFLDPRGSKRKTTGSYYTHHSLVNELIKSALLPVARTRLAEAGLPVIEEEATAGLLSDYAGLSDVQRANGEEALLSLKVCDPAAGSGHFLVKADDALGAEVARVRTGDEYPTEGEIQEAKGDVLTHCIYAVDVNPMAVELCKVSLWINASVRDQPLGFLDHHIKCGNSLIGATPELMAEGVPYEAFDHTLVGNDRERAKDIRKRNRQEEKGQRVLEWQVTAMIETPQDLARWAQLNELAEEQPQMARERYERYQTTPDMLRKRLIADAWTAAFFWPITEATEWAPTQGAFARLRDEGEEALPTGARRQIQELADRYRFFHWHLAFPDVFRDDGEGGFDVVLGNPPWERIKLQEKEFFADKDEEIANAGTAAARRRLIAQLPQTDSQLHAAYTEALRESEATSHFLRTSGRYPLSAVGDINTYQVFAGLVRQIVGPAGRVGVVVPSGIATD